VYAAPNPPYGAVIWYHLRQKERAARIVIADARSAAVAVLAGAEGPGLHRVIWNLRTTSGAAPAGDYQVRLEVGDRPLVKKLHVDAED
jgi:hypothetical protein